MDLISSQYHWTDEQILDRPLSRLTQIVAAIQRRQWLDDLSHRRLETAKLRTLCAYVASTLQLAEGADNVMLTEAAHLSLGTGTENPDAAPSEPPPADQPVRPAARIPLAQLPDAPPAIRAGDPTPMPEGVRMLPLDKIGALFGGAL